MLWYLISQFRVIPVRRLMKIGVLIGFAILLGGCMAEPQEFGIIGQTLENDMPVIYRLVDELPDQATRSALPLLTVISWRYDGSANNGMPAQSTNEAMIRLEDAIEGSILKTGLARHAYSRTGNGLKELAYYIADRDEFMAAFNNSLTDHPRYPIEINFYDDAEWEDFRKLLEAFRSGE